MRAHASAPSAIAATLPGAATWRRAAWLLVLVVPAHWWIVSELSERLQDIASGIDSPNIQRMDVAFVRELTPEAPAAPPLAPTAAPAPPERVPVTVADAASAPSAAASAASAERLAREARAKRMARAEREARAAREARSDREARSERLALQAREALQAARDRAAAQASAVETPPDASSNVAKPDEANQTVAASAAGTGLGSPTRVDNPAAASGTAPTPTAPTTPTTERSASSTSPNASTTGQATTSDAEPFEWPPSTRLNYVLTGNYQGEINGSARVQWVRQAERYQVQMDVNIGPDFAPLMTRRMTSDGLLGPKGLIPRRYDEQTRIAFSRRQVAIKFDNDRITLANGTERASMAGVQDSASQFVQLSYLFTLNPSLLKAGTTITLPVALPRRVDNWLYDVMTAETISTGVGDIVAYHVKPRRESPRPGELVAQAWFAPTLRYLPVRILITQEPDSVVDLVLKANPTLAAPEEK
jgi:Protein of unknown function (DUF3108)